MREASIIFTATDTSIDLVGAIFFVSAVFFALKFLWENHITTEGRIIYLFIIAISSLHIFQVAEQLLTNHAANFRIWDIINYLTAVFFLMVCHRIAKREKKPEIRVQDGDS